MQLLLCILINILRDKQIYSITVVSQEPFVLQQATQAESKPHTNIPSNIIAYTYPIEIKLSRFKSLC